MIVFILYIYTYIWAHWSTYQRGAPPSCERTREDSVAREQTTKISRRASASMPRRRRAHVQRKVYRALFAKISYK